MLVMVRQSVTWYVWLLHLSMISIIWRAPHVHSIVPAATKTQAQYDDYLLPTKNCTSFSYLSIVGSPDFLL
jgi:hypothetical protein